MEKNSAQDDAIRTHKGQVLLISCPGSGKTTTMIRRIHSMTEAGIPASSIVMVTFTEAAAREMKDRYHKSYGECGAMFCTIHSLCLKILSQVLGKPPRILSPEDQASLIRSSIRDAKIPAATAVKEIQNDISVFKSKVSDLDTFCPSLLSSEEFLRLYSIYEEKKHEADVMDFDDLLWRCLDSLKKNSRLLKKYRQIYQYIICDEYQDTNHIQKEILYLLAGEQGNLCVVGDDDQSIYSFRGANPDIMLDFKKDFPNAHEIHMDINYRSRPEIISAAKNLIEHNTQRFQKDIQAARNGNGQVIFHSSPGRLEEIEYLAREITRLRTSGIPLSSISVLSRTNQELEDVAAVLESHHLEYSSPEPIRDIYEHFIFTDIMAYLNLIDGNFRSEDLIRILNRPGRYLKESAFRNVKEFTETALTDAARSCSSQFHSPVEQVLNLYSDLCGLRGKTLQEKVSGISNRIGYQRYLDEYAAFTGQDSSSLLEKLNYYVSDSEHFADRHSWYSAAVSHIHCHRSQMKERTTKGVTLSTMHRSKGLEWDVVFIINCCEGYTPIAKAEKKSELEEERRLFYVAMTRARERLYLLNHTSKPGFKHKKTQVKPSIFLSEIKEDIQWRNKEDQKTGNGGELRRKEIEKEFKEGAPASFWKGMGVHHKTFGPGTVIQKTLSFVTVRFEEGDKIFFFEPTEY